MSTGGFTAVALYLTEQFGLVPPLTRPQVFQWNARRTVNAAGQMFPSPVTSNKNAPAHRPRLLFSLEACADWYAAGAPAPHSNQYVQVFETPAERNARLASRE